MTDPKPYSFRRAENAYFFETENGVGYRVALANGAFYFENLPPYLTVFELSIEVTNDANTIFIPTDKRVEDTLIQILTAFFEDNTNSLVYICDSIDGKHRARHRKFDSWFQRNRLPFLEKHDVAFQTEDFEVLASLIVHKSNPSRLELVQIFLDQPNLLGK